MCYTELVVVALKGDPCRASVKESLYYLKFQHPVFRVQQTCFRAAVQFLRVQVAPETHPPRADPSVDLARKVWRFSDGACQIGE